MGSWWWGTNLIRDYSWFYPWSSFAKNWHSTAFGTNLGEGGGGVHNPWESVMMIKFDRVQTPICLEKCTPHMIQVPSEPCSHCPRSTAVLSQTAGAMPYPNGQP